MPVVRKASQLEHRSGTAGAVRPGRVLSAFGTAVPMRAGRYQLEPGAVGPQIALGGQEAVAYVIAGTGSGRAAGEDFGLHGRRRLGASPAELTWNCGPARVAWTCSLPSRPRAAPRLRHRFARCSTAGGASASGIDPRHPGPARPGHRGCAGRRKLIRADRISYHPGDTAAAHYQPTATRVLRARRVRPAVLGSTSYRLTPATRPSGPGRGALVRERRRREFSFVEFWAPPRAGTVWTVAGDRCTWAPAG